MIKSKHLAKSIYRILGESDRPEEVAESVHKFLLKNNLIFERANIVYHLELLAEEKRKNETVQIETAREIDSRTVDLIKKLIESAPDAPVETKINEDLVGGFVARAGGYIYDGSVRSQLGRLRSALMETI